MAQWRSLWVDYGKEFFAKKKALGVLESKGGLLEVSFPGEALTKMHCTKQCRACFLEWSEKPRTSLKMSMTHRFACWSCACAWTGVGGWAVEGGCCTSRVLWLLHWQHMGSLKGERGEQGVRGQRDFHPGFLPSRQARWAGLRGWGVTHSPCISPFFFLAQVYLWNYCPKNTITPLRPWGSPSSTRK